MLTSDLYYYISILCNTYRRIDRNVELIQRALTEKEQISTFPRFELVHIK